jgi:hypothetical protein
MADAFYIYCIGEQDALAPLFDETLPDAIEPAATLQLITAGKLASVASVVPLADYGEEEIAARLSEATWVAARAMRHEKVLEHFAARASLVTLRFGTIYLTRAGVEEMLTQKQEELLNIIERFRGKEEWGVNIFCNRTRLAKMITSISPTLREMSERADAASAGQAYLLRKKIEAMRTDEVRTEIKRAVGEIERELSALSSSAARLRVRQAEAAEHGELAAKLAFLITRKGFADFHAAAEGIAHQRAEAGFRLELTGPWPAYNFVADLKADAL